MKLFKQAVLVFFLVYLQNIDALNGNKRIVLYFDINQTIIAGGVAEKRNFEHTIAGIFAKDIVAAWDGVRNQPYWEYLQNQIADDMPDVSRANTEFKRERKRRLLDFPHVLKDRYPALHERYQQERELMLTALSKANGHSVESAIFPSFFKLISWLEQSGYPYAINLRSFGNDLPFIVPVIEKKSSLTFQGEGKFVGRTLSIREKIGDKSIQKSYRTPAEIYAFFTRMPLRNYAIQDSVDYWKTYCYQSLGGKFFPIDINDSEVLTMFFDDIIGEADRGVVYPVKPNGEPENVQKLIELGYIVSANTKEAILNPNYYIDKVKAQLLGTKKPTTTRNNFKQKPRKKGLQLINKRWH